MKFRLRAIPAALLSAAAVLLPTAALAQFFDEAVGGAGTFGYAAVEGEGVETIGDAQA